MSAQERGKTLPKTADLPGAVCLQWVRCGKPDCRCVRGELHGPYFARYWRQRGRLHKQYVRQDDVEAVRAACARYRQEREATRQARQEMRAILQGFKHEREAMLREALGSQYDLYERLRRRGGGL